MKMADIVTELRRRLPEFTERFHDVVGISSIVATGSGAAIVTTKPHGLQTGYLVALQGVETRTPIATAVKSGLLTTFETSSGHDLTENNPDTVTVPLQGFTDPLWNASHELVRVDNRRTFTVRNALSAPVLNGNELLLEPRRIDGVNGIFSVTVTGTRAFNITGTFIPGTYTPFNGTVTSNPRIFAAAALDKAEELYRRDESKFWAFVVPGQVNVSKDRSTESDAVSARATGDTLRLLLLDEFSVYIFAPTDEELAGETALDICRDELQLPILKTLYGAKFDTGLSCPESDYRLTLTGHGISDYNGAYLIHEYAFQAPAALTDDDGAVDNRDRAFREIDFTLLDPHTPLTAEIDLDEVPLP